MFMVDVFIIPKNCKLPKCPSIDEYLNKCCTSIPWNVIQPLSKRYILYGSIYIILLKCHNSRDGYPMSMCQSLTVGGVTQIFTCDGIA